MLCRLSLEGLPTLCKRRRSETVWWVAYGSFSYFLFLDFLLSYSFVFDLFSGYSCLSGSTSWLAPQDVFWTTFRGVQSTSAASGTLFWMKGWVISHTRNILSNQYIHAFLRDRGVLSPRTRCWRWVSRRPLRASSKTSRVLARQPGKMASFMLTRTVYSEVCI